MTQTPSAHYILHEDGTIEQLVKPSEVAWAEIPVEKIIDGEVVTVDTKAIPIITIPESLKIE